MKIRKSPCKNCHRSSSCSDKCLKWRNWFAESWQEAAKPFREEYARKKKEKAALTALTAKAVNQGTTVYSIAEKEGESQDVQMP